MDDYVLQERTEFDMLSLSSVSIVGDDPLDELHRPAEIDRREPVRPTASQHLGRRNTVS